MLVLDEPLAGVDHDSAIDLAGTLRELVAGGVTVVIGPARARSAGAAHHPGRLARPRPGASTTAAPSRCARTSHRHMDPDPHGGEATPSGLGFER